MGLRCRTDGWVLIGLAGLLVSAGCADTVRLVQETERGGVVTYLYREDRGGPALSPYRAGALDLIKKKCGPGYLIVREGETRGSRNASGVTEGTEDEIKHRRWGLQFRCGPA